MLKNILWVALGGGIGSICRYLVALWMSRSSNDGFPWGTFAVNIAGCLLIGLLLAYFSKAETSGNELKLLLITGFCGGFTTFSAFSLESLALFQSGHTLQAILYIGSSILVGLLAVWGGFSLLK